MIIRDAKINHMRNLAIVDVDYHGNDIFVDLCDRGVDFSDHNDIYISFMTEKVEICDEFDQEYIYSLSTLENLDGYPRGTKIGDIETTKPVKTSRIDAYMEFCGTITSIEKVPEGSIDKHTKDLQMGHFITIKVHDMSFVINLQTKSDTTRAFPRIPKIQSDVQSDIPLEIGQKIHGGAMVIGCLI